MRLLYGVSFAIALLPSIVTPPHCEAQIKADSTSRSRITSLKSPSKTIQYEIHDGVLVNGNLFHSFERFDLNAGQSAEFIIPPKNEVTSIFARVTGGQASRINGTLIQKTPAHLFLINPNGIEFLSQSKLDLGGSFLGTTATGIDFQNGQSFRAIDPQSSQLLKVTAPVGIQFGPQANPIKISATMPLTLNAGQSLSLLGGDLIFQEGSIGVSKGQIMLAALNTNQYMPIQRLDQTYRFNPSPDLSFRNIHLSQGSEIKTRLTSTPDSENPGGINILAQDLTLNQNSLIRTGSSENIVIQLKGRFLANEQSSVSSNITELSDSLLPANAGMIVINAKDLILSDGSQIGASIFGEGNAGRIQLSIEDQILITGISDQSRLSSAILSDGFRRGMGGDIFVRASSIFLEDGGLIRSQVFNQSQGGKIQIQTRDLRLGDGSQISSTAVSPNLEATAGSIDILAENQIVLTGSRIIPEGVRRFTQIRAESRGPGQAGDIRITTPNLTLLEGATIRNGTAGQAASIILQIGDRLLISDRFEAESSGIISDATGEGKSGLIRILAPFVEVQNGGIISNQVFGTGQGGNIEIEAPFIGLANQAQITSQSRGDAPAGDIVLKGKLLILSNQALISTQSDLNTGGNIELNLSEHVFLTEGSQIATSAQGDGGEIRSFVTSQPWLIALPNNDVSISADSRSQQGGNINLNQFRVLGFEVEGISPQNRITATGNTPQQAGEINTQIITEVGPKGIPPTPTITATTLTQQCQSGAVQSQRSTFTNVGLGMTGDRQSLSEYNVWEDTRNLSFATTPKIAFRKPGSPPPNRYPFQVAQGWYQTDKGEIVLGINGGQGEEILPDQTC